MNIIWYHVLQFFRWSGPNFGPKVGQKIRANDTNISIECAKLGAPQRNPAKKVVAGPGGV